MLRQDYDPQSGTVIPVDTYNKDCLMKEISQLRIAQQFDGYPIDSDALYRILDAGRRAPSAKNRQPWRFIAVTSPEMREVISQACYSQEITLNAPCYVVLCTTNTEYKMPNGLYSYPFDHGMAASFMMIQAMSEGLCVRPVISFIEDDIKVALSVPFSMRVVTVLLVGSGTVSQGEAERLPIDRVISYNHW